MKISFHGAAQTVTGSKHLIALQNGTNILLDCGLFQGMGNETDALNSSFGFEASSIKYLLLSHAHIDHCGLVPKLVKEGFKGNIFCTPATKELASILLQDSAAIQRDDTKYINKKRAAKNQPPIEPLYTPEDVKNVLPLFKEVEYGNWFQIEKGIEVLYTDAGHIIGSASVHVRITENDSTRQISFSGDVGRYQDIILKSPQVFPQADYIILESTYGNSLHGEVNNTQELLLSWINKTCVEKKGKLIIPAFSVGRTQELLFYINAMSLENKLPHIPVFVDSPLSNQATAVVKSHPENFNSHIQEVLKVDKDPFDFPGLTFITSSEESKKLNDMHQPMIIISASGMADAGRIKHHILNNINDANNTILIVGYCEPHSLGGRLMNGEKEVRIYGDYFKVVAEVGVMRSMSAHGDYNDLCQYVSCQNIGAVKQVFIVHGEYKVQLDFKQSLLKNGFKNVQVPAMHESYELG